MILLESKLIEEINRQNTAEAIKIYKEIFDNIKKSDFSSGCYLRSTKNYLISLNSLLFMNICNNPICKKTIYEKRNSIIKEIENNLQ